ncbi:hypothetical protein PG990_006838 [Apiospora arundinis]
MSTSPPPSLLESQYWCLLPAGNIYENFHSGAAVPSTPNPVPGNSFDLQYWNDSNASSDTTPSLTDGNVSPLSQAGTQSCPHCNHQTPYGKDLRRHIVETHEKPLFGEWKIGCVEPEDGRSGAQD